MRTTIDRIGKYELKAVLARTPMSTVYDGWDSDIARRVAIKLMPLSAMDDSEAGEAYLRFKRGAQAAGQLNHPNIVAVYDYGETQDYAYLVMEFVDGQTLKGLFDSNQRFAVAEICKIIGSVLDALQYSHDRGVVHRDVKPANIMFTTGNQVKITDFGIARLEDSEMTQAGMVIGTPAYMSPEQFLGEKIDLRTDIYSTGVVLYHMLTGERPYEGNLATIMHKVLYGVPLLPSHISTVVTPEIDAVVTRAMTRNREDRFNSAAEFNAALQATLTASPLRSRHAGALNVPLGRPRPPVGRRSKSSSRTLVILAVAASVVVLAGGYSFLRPSPTPPANPVKASAKQDEARLQLEQELSRRQLEQQQARRQQEQAQQEQQQEQLRRQEEQARVQDQRDQLRRQQDEQQQARLQQQQEQARQQQEQVRQRQEQEQSRLRLAQEQARQKQAQEQARQKPVQDQSRPKQGQELVRPKQEPESAPAPGGAPMLYPVTSINGMVGLVCVTITAETAGRYGLESPQGMVVTGVSTGGAADKAGIQERDVILKIKGSEVHDLSVLAKLAADNPAGQPVPVDIIRHGSHKVVQLLIDQQRH